MTPPGPPAAGPPACLDCGEPLVGAYCAACGQKAQALRQPLGPFLAEAFVEYFGFDGRTWRSARDLLFRPGALTVEYVEGRRRRSLSPLKLYLLATLIFFVTLSVRRSGDTGGSDDEATDAFSEALAGGFDAGRGAARADSLRADSLRASSARAEPAVPRPAPLADTLLAASTVLDLLGEQAATVATRRKALAPALPVLAALDTAAARRAGGLAASLVRDSVRIARAQARVEALPDTVLVRPAFVGLPDSLWVGLGDDSGYERGHDLGSDIVPRFVGWLPEWMKGTLARDVERAETPDEHRAARRTVVAALGAQVPTAMFAVLPLFALLLKLLYLGGGGIEPRARRRRPAPLGARDGASRGARAWVALRTGTWRVRVVLDRWAARRRIRRRRRWWRRLVRQVRAAVSPRRVRVARVAWLRRAVTARRPRYYAEHVVFTLHVHALVFAAFFGLVVLNGGSGEAQPAWADKAGSVIALWVPVYFVLAQRRVYAQTWGRTLAKSVVLGIAYFNVLVLGFFVAAALAARMG